MYRIAFVLCVIFCHLTNRGTCNKGSLGEQEETQKLSRFVSRRNSGGDTDYQLRFAHDSFVATADATVERLIGSHSPILVHTREEETDVLKLVRVSSNVTIPLQIHTYYNLKAVTHLPVSVVSVLIPEVTEEPAPLSFEAQERLQQLEQVLGQSSTVVDGAAFEPGPQTSRQMEIIETTSQFVSSVIDNEEMVSVAMLSNFSKSLNKNLMENAREAVRDYLLCLNETITALLRDQNVTVEEWQTIRVAVELEPFATPTSFIVQYYEALLNSPLRNTTEYPRIILLPGRTQTSSLLVMPSVYASVRATTAQNISELFYGMAVPTHKFLSEAAAELICSDDLDLPSCNSAQSRQKLPSGFVTAVERTYVIVIIFVGTSAVVLGITLLCIYLEGRAVKRERREEMERMKRYDGPNVFSDIDGKMAKDKDGSSAVLTKRVKKGEILESDSTNSLEDELRPKSVTHSEVSF